MPMPQEIWDRLVEMSSTGRGMRPRGARRTPRLPERKRYPLERQLEEWLEAHPEELRRIGFDVVVHRRQMLCIPGHDGTIDLLCRRAGQPNRYLVIELKAEEIRRDAVAQVLGYVGWLRTRPGVDDATALIIGLNLHIQVPWVLKTVPDGLVQVTDWSELDVPDELARDLGLRR